MGLPRLLVVAAGIGLLGCGGGGGSGGPPPPPPIEVPPPGHDPAQPTTLPLHIEGLYLTQGSQRLDRSVPLVQGKAACLRVFVLANAWSGPAPPVRVRIVNPAGADLLNEVIPAPGPGVPRAVDEAAQDQVWNLRLDGSLIQPGNAVLARLDPPAPGVPSGSLSYPADGAPLAMQVVPVAPLRITLIPIRAQGRVGLVHDHGRTVASWEEDLTRVFPVGKVTVTVGSEFVTDLDPHDDPQQSRLLSRLDRMRLAGGNDYQYFYGVYPARTGTNKTGLGYRATDLSKYWRTAIGWDGHTYRETLTHELGHNLGLRHAPCGPPGNYPMDVNPAFPYADGGIGACGFDVVTGLPKDPKVYKDLMSYCMPRWSSDYDCKAILRFRTGEPMGPPHHALAAEVQDCLLVSGDLRHGLAELDAAFMVRRTPIPPSPGEYLLTALDAHGRVLEEVSFAPAELEDLEQEAGLGVFTLVIPMTEEMKHALATLRVSRDGVPLGERHAPGHRLGAEAFTAHAPRDGHGLVHLLWDPTTYPEVIVKDGHSGEVISMGAGGRLALETRAHELECLFSDGLRTVVRRVPVQ